MNQYEKALASCWFYAESQSDHSGILVPPGDAAALADVMATLAKNPKRRNEMGVAARERQQKLFAPTVVVPLLLNVYQRVAGNGHNGTHNNNHSHPWAEL